MFTNKFSIMEFSFLIPYIHYLVFGLIALIGLYIRSFVQENAKVVALKRHNKELIEQTEEIKSKYSKAIEEIRREYNLDLEKRKYQYESKKEQYISFFRLLDTFASDQLSVMQERVIPIINEFNRNYMNASSRNNKKEETKAVTAFMSKLNSIAIESNKEFTKIKQETNTIRLIASDLIINSLDSLELAYSQSNDIMFDMIKAFPALMSMNDQAGIMEHQHKLQASGLIINQIKSKLINQMRLELNEI